MSDELPATPEAPSGIVLNSKKERPNLGYAINRAGKIRYLSPKQVLLSDDKKEGCPRKFANAYRFGKKLARTAALKDGVGIAETLEHYLRTGKMVLTPVLKPAAKFFPSPRNPLTDALDLICEESLGDIARAVELRDRILKAPNAGNMAAALVEVHRLAGLTARGIPFDGAADLVHFRGTYQDKEGVTRPEPPGLVVIGINDLKSISQINTKVTPSGTLKGWADTDAEVVSDPQILSYSKHRLDKHTDATHVRGEKTYVEKKRRFAAIRGGLISRQQVEDRWGALQDRVIDEMIQVATADRIEDVRPALGSCDSYTHLEPCGFPGCGIGCPPGMRMETRRVVNAQANAETMLDGDEKVAAPCVYCKGKGKSVKGCGYRGTSDCPESPIHVAVPLIDLNPTNTGVGMSLFDRVPTAAEISASENTPTVPVTTPMPPPSAEQIQQDKVAYAAQVAAAQAKFAADLKGGGQVIYPTTTTPTPPTPPTPPVVTSPTPPAAPSPPTVGQQTIELANTIGEKISVMLCAPGDEYMVDAEDGHAPCRMKLQEVRAGAFKFVDAMGAKVTLNAQDNVWRLAPNAAPAVPAAPPAKQPCGAPGCGEGCPAGLRLRPMVEGDGSKSTSPTEQCPACAGKGAVSIATMQVKSPDAPRTPWLDQSAPLSDEEIARMRADNVDPAIIELAVAHKLKFDEEQRKKDAADPKAAGRGGNCDFSGKPTLFADQPSVVDGKIVCPLCGMEKTIPREIKKARPRPTEMVFPNHRRPKPDAATTPPTTVTTPPTPSTVTAPTAPTPPATVTSPTPPVTISAPTPPPNIPPNTGPLASTFAPAPTRPGEIFVTDCEVGKSYLVFGQNCKFSGTVTPPSVEGAALPEKLYLFERPGADPYRLPPTGQVSLLGNETLTSTDVEILVALFRERALAYPRAMLSSSAVTLLQRLKLVD